MVPQTPLLLPLTLFYQRSIVNMTLCVYIHENVTITLFFLSYVKKSFVTVFCILLVEMLVLIEYFKFCYLAVKFLRCFKIWIKNMFQKQAHC